MAPKNAEDGILRIQAQTRWPPVVLVLVLVLVIGFYEYEYEYDRNRGKFDPGSAFRVRVRTCGGASFSALVFFGGLFETTLV